MLSSVVSDGVAEPRCVGGGNKAPLASKSLRKSLETLVSAVVPIRKQAETRRTRLFASGSRSPPRCYADSTRLRLKSCQKYAEARKSLSEVFELC